MNPPLGTVWRWVLMLVVILVLGWLWLSWRGGWFPFGAHGGKMQKQQSTKQQVIDSLSAPSPVVATTSSLDRLTAPPVTRTAAGTASPTSVAPANTTSILESLTPKK